jgi:hypothetical protein
MGFALLPAGTIFPRAIRAEIHKFPEFGMPLAFICA